MKARTKDEQREYMRAYRARKKAENAAGGPPPVAPVKTPVQDTQDMSREITDVKLYTVGVTRKPMPSYLAAPDEACASCTHERHEWHLETPCRYPVGPRGRKCGCPVWIAPLDDSEPF